MTFPIAAGTPAATDPSAVAAPPAAAPVPVPPPAATPPAPPAPPADPSWLKARLEQAKAVGDREATARAQAELDVLRATKVRAEQLEPVVVARVAREMATLSAAQQAAVKQIAGDDPAAQLRTIDALASTWTAAAPANPAAPPVPPPAAPPVPIPAPATSAPPNPAPPPPNPNPQPNVLATYQALEKSNPVQAANYKLAHWGEIQAAQQTPRA